MRYKQLINSPAFEHTKFLTYRRTFDGNIAGEFYQLKKLMSLGKLLTNSVTAVSRMTRKN